MLLKIIYCGWLEYVFYWKKGKGEEKEEKKKEANK